MNDLLENIVIVLRTINYLIENQETIKKLILWLNKKIFRDNIEYMNHPNTPVTFNLSLIHI